MFRLLGLLGGLSGAMDLGSGAGLDESLKRCVVGARLARAIGATDAEVRDVMYTSLLEHLGCTAVSYESGQLFGDDISVVRLSFLMDPSRPGVAMRTFVPGVAAAAGRSRAATLLTALRTVRDSAGMEATCDVGERAARRLGLGDTVVASLGQMTAMWNGKGWPRHGGSAIPRPLRVAHVAGAAVLFAEHTGIASAAEEVSRRAGTWLDPELAGAFSVGLLDGLEEADALELSLELEPDPVLLVSATQLPDVAATFGDLVDLKSPSLHGHSRAVAGLAGDAATVLGLAEAERVRVAGHLHDLGRAGVSSRIWSKPSALTRSERDQARLHPYFTERVLARVPALEDVARLAGQHHERCDGSGYHRGLRGPDLPLASRVLAAADRYQRDVEGGPRRAPLSAREAASGLASAVRGGALDREAVDAVLHVTGDVARRRSHAVGGLTDRQLEVLRLVTTGLSNRQIGARLGISTRTAEHHVQDVYERIGVRSRAAAALFAMEHGLARPPA
ncbi:MAG TPA: HD domain-containing phosphohydrolase [Intrasporangium sp.]|uniref:HD domain-containing phosphohydrolase n=1 Tax=Intrasporangium sp. TaxID=1925024 RepID=UPI002B48B5E2|nr:HD domain-containing phosphohydrolase [Intrasporangium sp.]HKX66182.1 HD domain-containing phosphohydrolase [Intrasporangium sp.]